MCVKFSNNNKLFVIRISCIGFLLASMAPGPPPTLIGIGDLLGCCWAAGAYFEIPFGCYYPYKGLAKVPNGAAWGL